MKPFRSLVDGEWADKGPYPHVLILPRNDQYIDYVETHRETLEQQTGLQAMPPEWTHITVQSIQHRVDAEAMKAMRAALATTLADIPPFEIQLGPAFCSRSGVSVAIYPEDAISRFHQRVRQALETVPGVELPPTPKRFWPHTSLGYCIGQFDSDTLSRRLYHDLRPPRVDYVVNQADLVWQYERPDLGYYTWDRHSTIPLSGASSSNEIYP